MKFLIFRSFRTFDINNSLLNKTRNNEGLVLIEEEAFEGPQNLMSMGISDTKWMTRPPLVKLAYYLWRD